MSEAFGWLYGAEESLNNLFATTWFFPAINASFGPGQELLGAIKSVTTRSDFDAEIGWPASFAIARALSVFEGAVKAELAVANAYFVTRKGGYDTLALVANAEMLFPTDLGQKIPTAILDLREAGKCLAFELPTAAGFHVLRATETVLRAYWGAVGNGKPHPRKKTMGDYLKRMQDEGGGNAKARAALQQIKDLHRNPLMHPEETLTLDEAIGLFGIVQSAISAMLKDIPLPTPNPIAAGTSP
ncbi:MAG: hypothetical protein EXQ98_04135 [Alphaproteobacteria bacterium]|nr:hypothetical protein [Alphaproteobacteria bacterium]